MIDPTRPMDNMPLHFDLPQEDEIAVNLLSAGVSYYMPLWFMRQVIPPYNISPARLVIILILSF